MSSEEDARKAEKKRLKKLRKQERKNLESSDSKASAASTPAQPASTSATANEHETSPKETSDDEKKRQKALKKQKKAEKRARKAEKRAQIEADNGPSTSSLSASQRTDAQGSSAQHNDTTEQSPSQTSTVFKSRSSQQSYQTGSGRDKNDSAPLDLPMPAAHLSPRRDASSRPSPFYPRAPPAPASSELQLDPALFPPGMDISAIRNQASSSGSAAKPRSTAPSKPTAAALDAALASMTSQGGASGKGSRVARASAPRNAQRLTDSKEATVNDAQGLTEKQILAEKLYQPHQIKWLQEAGLITTLHKGSFTAAERQVMEEAFAEFCSRHKFSYEEGQELLLSDRSQEQVELYNELTKHIAASIEGRHLRSVRRYVLETFHPHARQGSWSADQIRILVQSYRELGPKWADIGKRCGRLARDCRTRWRDAGGEQQLTSEVLTASQAESAAQEGAKEATASASQASEGQDDDNGPRKNLSSWSSEEVVKLRQAVAEVCAQMNIDLDRGGLPPWKVIAAKVGTRAPGGCQRKWDEIQTHVKRGREESEIVANKRARKHDMWQSERDDKLLVDRIQAQEYAMEMDDEKAIDWSEIADDELQYARNELSKAWRRLKDKRMPEGARSSISLKVKLEALRPVVEKRYEKWYSGQSQPSSTAAAAQTWSAARRAADDRKRKAKKAKGVDVKSSPKDAGDVIDSEEEDA
ncbi:unnamed protein product [Jaminaea pallidilutea]